MENVSGISGKRKCLPFINILFNSYSGDIIMLYARNEMVSKRLTVSKIEWQRKMRANKSVCDGRTL